MRLSREPVREPRFVPFDQRKCEMSLTCAASDVLSVTVVLALGCEEGISMQNHEGIEGATDGGGDQVVLVQPECSFG